MPKKKTKPKKPTQRWKLYQVTGNKLERKNKFCPKCGIGIFMAKHKDRFVCGNCNYVEFVKREK
jgi:small subunit ribosomal protein S27Ae